MKKHVLFIWAISLATAATAQNPGDLNNNFGQNGHQVYDITNSEDDAAAAIDIQADGKIIVASEQEVNGNRNWVISRMNPDGSMDNTFDFDGQRIIDINSNDQVYDVKVLSNGKIIAVGITNDSITSYDGVAVLLNSDGSLDNNFGDQGIVQKDQTAGEIDIWTNVHETANNTVVIAGNMYAANKNYFSVRSLTMTGADNPAFNSSLEFTELPNISSCTVTGLDVNSNGEIMVVGYGLENTQYKNIMCAYHANGQKNNNFWTTSYRIFHLVSGDLNAILDMKYDENDQIVATGVLGTSNAYDVMVMRLHPSGFMDTTMNSTGWIQSDLSIGASDIMTNLEILPDNSILVSGIIDGNEIHPVVAHYNTDGTLNSNFGTNGKSIEDFGYGNHDMVDAALKNGILYMTGTVQGNTSEDVLVSSHFIYSTVGVAEIDAQKELVVYPNPASDILNVEVPEGDFNEVKILDIAGNTVLTSNVHTGNPTMSVNVSDLRSGVYLLKLQGDSSARTTRFIIQ